jgi:hypothetical protein
MLENVTMLALLMFLSAWTIIAVLIVVLAAKIWKLIVGAFTLVFTFSLKSGSKRKGLF